MEKKTITVEADIAADRNKVWDLYTKPEHITKWNFASDDWECPRAENDLRVGGKYAARMQAKDGSFGFEFDVNYDEVIDKQKLSYTMGDGRQATTIFEDADGKTKVTTSFDPENQNDPEMQRSGWQAILNNLKK